MSSTAFLLRLFLAIVLIVNGIGVPPVAAAPAEPAATREAAPCHGAAEPPEQADVIAAGHVPAGTPMDCCDERGACVCIHACPGLPIAAATVATAPIRAAAPARFPPHYRFEPASRLHRPPIA